MSEGHLSILVVAGLVLVAITMIFGGILQDYALAGGVGAVAAAGFAGAAFLLSGRDGARRGKTKD